MLIIRIAKVPSALSKENTVGWGGEKVESSLNETNN